MEIKYIFYWWVKDIYRIYYQVSHQILFKISISDNCLAVKYIIYGNLDKLIFYLNETL